MRQANARFRQTIRHPLVLGAILALCLAFCILAAAAALVWLPARARDSAAQQDLARAEDALASLRYRHKLAKDYASLAAHIEKLEHKLRQAKADPEFVHDIEALAARTGVTVAQFSSHRKEQAPGVNATSFEFSLNAPYANVRRFILELSNLEEFTVIERASFDREEQTVRTYLVLLRLQKVPDAASRN
jgi:hypothetical protein